MSIIVLSDLLITDRNPDETLIDNCAVSTRIRDTNINKDYDKVMMLSRSNIHER